MEDYKDLPGGRISPDRPGSENLVMALMDLVNWDAFSNKEDLSEEFINRFGYNLDWFSLLTNNHVPEPLIEKYIWEIPFGLLSYSQPLSEDFMDAYADRLDWTSMSRVQVMSEEFIHAHAYRVWWPSISSYQPLSEEFIEAHADLVTWECISGCQVLSEDFIDRHADRVSWYAISKTQDISGLLDKYRDRIHMDVYMDSWRHLTAEERKRRIEETGQYECHDDHFIAYKGVTRQHYPITNYRFQYEMLGTYETPADYSSNLNSYGFAMTTRELAFSLFHGVVMKVKVMYDDLARVLDSGNFARASRFTVCEIYEKNKRQS